LHPEQAPRQAHLQKMLPGAAPVVAVTDYIRAWPLSISNALNGRYVALGTDGFGRSDTRQALRRFFEVDRHQIVLAALHALALDGEIDPAACAQAIERYAIDCGDQAPWRL
jgi:pyruvate dehydrogenase E1 component